jgi:ATP-dependent Lhr-like helicase
MASCWLTAYLQIKSRQLSIAMNDYGFELLTDEDIPIEAGIWKMPTSFLSTTCWRTFSTALNANEMARRKFRDIAHIGGLVFTGYPGQHGKEQTLAGINLLLFEVFNEYEPDNLLVRQAYNEALGFSVRGVQAAGSPATHPVTQTIILKTIERPTPFAFPIMVDSLGREKLTTETLEERIAKMARSYGAEGVKAKPREGEAKPAGKFSAKVVRKKGF